MIISFISLIERSLPHNLISPPMTERRLKRTKTGRWWTRREVEDDAVTGEGRAAQVDEEEVEEGGDVGGDEGDGVEEGWRKEVTKVLLNSGWLVLLTTKGIS